MFSRAMDTTPDRKRARLNDDLFINANPSHNNDREVLSPLEQLPRELVWEIIDYAQEVHNLLLVSFFSLLMHFYLLSFTHFRHLN